jgi:hypothetical protein
MTYRQGFIHTVYFILSERKTLNLLFQAFLCMFFKITLSSDDPSIFTDAEKNRLLGWGTPPRLYGSPLVTRLVALFRRLQVFVTNPLLEV